MKSRTTLIVSALAIIFLAFWISCQEKTKRQETAMENQLNSQLGTLIDSCWNDQNADAFENISTADFTRNLNGISVAKNQTEMEAHMKVFFTAFPDLKVSLEESEVKGNKVFLLWQSTGTNTGIFGEVAATGKKVKINGLSHLYFDDTGRLYREDVFYNELDLLQQLGYTLAPPILE